MDRQGVMAVERLRCTERTLGLSLQMQRKGRDGMLVIYMIDAYDAKCWKVAREGSQGIQEQSSCH